MFVLSFCLYWFTFCVSCLIFCFSICSMYIVKRVFGAIKTGSIWTCYAWVCGLVSCRRTCSAPFPFHRVTWFTVHSNNILFVRYEAFTAVTMKNVVFWDVALCRSCVNRRFRVTYRLHLQGRKIRERWASVTRWLQTEPPVVNNQLFNNRERGRVCHMGIQQSGEGCGICGEGQQQVAEGCVEAAGCRSGVRKNSVLLSEHWPSSYGARNGERVYVPPKRRLTQDLHSATSQKTTFFNILFVQVILQTNLNYITLNSTNIRVDGG
jgi:hypothetical protein